MLKRLSLLLAGFVLAACGAISPPGASPVQKAVNVTAVTCSNVDASIVALGQAVKAGALKRDAAEKAYKALETAQTGCVTALATFQAAATAAAAASAPK